MKTLIRNVTRQLHDLHHAQNWMGSSFDERLEWVDAAEAFKRPLPDLHSVAEIVAHLTAWRQDALLKLQTGKGRLTEADEENWLPNDKLKAKGWDQLKADFYNSLDDILRHLETRDDTFLDEQHEDQTGERHPYRYLVDGLLHHDIYHLGQIGIIIKLLKQ